MCQTSVNSKFSVHLLLPVNLATYLADCLNSFVVVNQLVKMNLEPIGILMQETANVLCVYSVYVDNTD